MNATTIFIDESGDLGSGNRASRIFVFALVYCHDPVGLRFRIKRGLRQVGWSPAHGYEFKFVNDSHEVRTFFADIIRRLDIEAAVVAIRKQDLPWALANQGLDPNLRNQPSRLYSFLCLHHLALDMAHNIKGGRVNLVFDRRVSEYEMGSFQRELQRHLREKFIRYARRLPPPVTIRHARSERDAGIQVADYVAGSVFQYLEQGRDQWYRQLAPKIRHKQVFGTLPGMKW